MSSATVPEWIATPALTAPIHRAFSPAARQHLRIGSAALSRWTHSRSKRLFDVACVLCSLPLLLPLLAVIALAVRLTSPGPAIYRQQRVGRNGRCFRILKFRTMLHNAEADLYPLTTSSHPSFTSIGPFLRRSKLDELPQLLNVLTGDMSLVGPRPKPPFHEINPLPCRPGITGAATLAFAREEFFLDRIPKQNLTAYYFHVVLPAKRKLDSGYLAEATCCSDLKLIVRSLSRQWDDGLMNRVLLAHASPKLESTFEQPL